MRIAIDTMGGDHGPGVVVQGALRALPELGRDAELLLVGDEAQLRPALGAQPQPNTRIVHAPDVIGMHEPPAQAVRRKPGSSIAVAIRLVQEGGADAVLSPGSTGAVVAGALFGLGRIRRVLRPAIATLFPTEGRDCVVLDVGANSDCKPAHLLQFGILGALYANIRLGCERPRVGLLNIGEEESKGNELAQAAWPLLQHSGLHFVGNVEGRDLLAGRADVVVCDGFVGNIVLKFAESMLGFTRGLLRAEIAGSRRLQLGAALLGPAFAALKKRLDYQEFGGAPLLGVDGVVVIAHGKSSVRAIESAVKSCAVLVENRYTERVSERLQEIGGEILERNEQRTDLGNG
jgi:glycerol-3-phosphate acyltransferase PlsX